MTEIVLVITIAIFQTQIHNIWNTEHVKHCCIDNCKSIHKTWGRIHRRSSLFIARAKFRVHQTKWLGYFRLTVQVTEQGRLSIILLSWTWWAYVVFILTPKCMVASNQTSSFTSLGLGSLMKGERRHDWLINIYDPDQSGPSPFVCERV